VLAVTLILAAPIVLGPAWQPLLRLLGAQTEHHCACGMVRGRCGCEECEAIEHERTHRAPSHVPTLKNTCSGDDELAIGAGLPQALPPSPSAHRISPPAREPHLEWLSPAPWASFGGAPPPTPPPRSRA
jgi:hypothetical protein